MLWNELCQRTWLFWFIFLFFYLLLFFFCSFIFFLFGYACVCVCVCSYIPRMCLSCVLLYIEWNRRSHHLRHRQYTSHRCRWPAIVSFRFVWFSSFCRFCRLHNKQPNHCTTCSMLNTPLLENWFLSTFYWHNRLFLLVFVIISRFLLLNVFWFFHTFSFSTRFLYSAIHCANCQLTIYCSAGCRLCIFGVWMCICVCVCVWVCVCVSVDMRIRARFYA